ncbi:MAG: type VI secretion system baseplate subunit TssK [Betaproteobacteria bacterium]|nr:type VI secretion system baseplate subunit TssK [Betaproteobacteria bacterium]
MIPEKIIWAEGMAVSPVHFQQQDRYFDMQVRVRSNMLRPYAWGFTEFLIDEQSLSMGKVVLSKAQGILPDGTLFEIGHGQESLVMDIAPGMTDKKRVMLALPISFDGALESRDEAASGLATRYIRNPTAARDSNAYKNKSSGEIQIFCGRFDLRLMFEEDANIKGFVTMPVAQVIECRQDQHVILDKDFSPTFLHLGASPVLSGYLREVLGLLNHRGDHLASRISNSGQTGTAEIADFLLLQCINSLEPVFRHQSAIASLHPESFYALLLALAGELATFVEGGKRPHSLPAYDHGAQYKSFALIMEQARYALSMVLEQHAVLLPLQPRKDNVSYAPIHDKKLLGTSIFVLVAHADMDQEQLRTLLPRQLKIGTPENIRELVNGQLPGVKIQPLPVAPRQIPFHAGKSYFQLDLTSKQRAQFETSTGCAVHVSGTFPGLQLQLWAIKE